jgi:hypothetical protein
MQAAFMKILRSKEGGKAVNEEAREAGDER